MANKKIHHSTGIMNKLRDRMPAIIILLIVAFLATIIFEWGMNYLGLREEGYVFASVNNEEIRYQEFEQMVQQQLEQMRMQDENMEITETTIQQVREQVWNSMIQQRLIRQEINRLGITVSDNEILDIIYNRPDELPQPVRQNFIDSLGVFNIGFYQQALTMKTPEANMFWTQVEQYMRETLLSQKLQSVISNSIIVTYDDILNKYRDENIFADIEYIFFDPNKITDTTKYAATEEEMRQYYEENIEEFKQPESVKLRYVMFNEAPTAEDTATVIRMVEGFITELRDTPEEDSALIIFVNANSKAPYSDEYQNPSGIGKGTLDFLFSANPGDVSDAIVDEDGIKIVRLLSTKGGTEQFVKASHILINMDIGEEEARRKAMEVLQQVRAGGDFNEIAVGVSEDPTAKENKGNLGWFGKGAMVEEFENAAFSAGVGSIIGPVKSQFGFHIIKVEGRGNKEFRFAEIRETVTPSARTRNLVRNHAEEFYREVRDGGNLDSVAARENISVMMTPDIVQDGMIPGLGQNKRILNWAFKGKPGDVAEPVRIQTGFGVYQIAEKTSEGYKNFDSIKITMIKPRVEMKKKNDLMFQDATELKSKIQNNDFNSIVELREGLSVETADSISGVKPAPAVGVDVVFNTVVFNMQAGEISDPIRGIRGIFLVKVNNITPFDETDFRTKATEIRRTLFMEKQQRVVQEWINSLQQRAEIIDNRDIFLN